VSSFLLQNGLIVAASLFGAALVILGYLVLKPGRKRLPLDRRRPGVAAPQGTLTTMTNAATSAIDKVLGGRQRGLAARLDLAGIKTPVRDVVLLLGATVLALFAAGLVLGAPLIGLLFAALVPLIGWLVLSVKTGRRREVFAQSLDENLQMMAGSLRAGYSLLQAVSTLATEAAQPASDEMQRVVNETRVGRPINDALENSAQRMDNEDFFWISQAIAINREVGGNLADVLEGVAHTIRERAQLRRQVDALSAEGKLSALILMALPLVVLLLLLLINPHYLVRFVDNPIGLLMLAAAVVLLLIGGLWLRVMVRIKY